MRGAVAQVVDSSYARDARPDAMRDSWREASLDGPPAVRVVDDAHNVAFANRASDIHIEPIDNGGRIRFRVDGILREHRPLTSALLEQVVSRIKLMASMDIADRRQPQDGRYQVALHERSMDARVSSMPTISGEKLVIRLLDMQSRAPSLEELGMPRKLLARYRSIVHAPYGFVVVCGPTGSGKTTTLYASIAERNDDTQNICTVEDPVEVRMPGVAQVQINERAGVTFASALRAFLRQDPNVLMVGEMRDAETAKVALSAALSGQLIMTTLHASDAPRSVERLVELGLSRRAIAAALSGVLAQRLVRTLCGDCRVRTDVDARDRGLFAGMDAGAVYRAGGCRSCDGTGYSGRTGLFEYISIADDLREAIADGHPAVALASLATARGYEPMWAEGIRLVRAGVTSLDELHRVLAIGRDE